MQSSYDESYERVLCATKREELAQEYVQGLNDLSDLHGQVINLVNRDYMPEWDKDNPKPSPKYSNDISKLQRSYYCDRELYRKSKINELFLQLADQKFLNLCKKTQECW